MTLESAQLESHGDNRMKFETFKAGAWIARYQYKSFEPVLVDHAWIWEDATINALLESANRALGELNAFSLIVPDIDLFIEMHVVKEAQTSSRIEGTQTGMEEALMPEDQIQPEKRDDWREVRNYVDAVNGAIAELRTLPLSNRLLRTTHEILMRGVRGENKQPGEFRTSQNWIGGSSLTDAVFIPPHPDGVPALMSDLEKFWHDDSITVPHLIRLAISHYQFETIHPFLDGNGRIGRLLVPLYLVSNGLLVKPSLYLSDFFERNRASYYDADAGARVQRHDSLGAIFPARGGGNGNQGAQCISASFGVAHGRGAKSADPGPARAQRPAGAECAVSPTHGGRGRPGTRLEYQQPDGQCTVAGFCELGPAARGDRRRPKPFVCVRNLP